MMRSVQKGYNVYGEGAMEEISVGLRTKLGEITGDLQSWEKKKYGAMEENIEKLKKK